MDRVVFNLMNYPAGTIGTTRDVLTFRENADSILVGRIIAPPGTELCRRLAPARLKVPSGTLPAQFEFLDAQQAITAAKARLYGLTFEAIPPAGQGIEEGGSNGR